MDICVHNTRLCVVASLLCAWLRSLQCVCVCASCAHYITRGRWLNTLCLSLSFSVFLSLSLSLCVSLIFFSFLLSRTHALTHTQHTQNVRKHTYDTHKCVSTRTHRYGQLFSRTWAAHSLWTFWGVWRRSTGCFLQHWPPPSTAHGTFCLSSIVRDCSCTPRKSRVNDYGQHSTIHTHSALSSAVEVIYSITGPHSTVCSALAASFYGALDISYILNSVRLLLHAKDKPAK